MSLRIRLSDEPSSPYRHARFYRDTIGPVEAVRCSVGTEAFTSSLLTDYTFGRRKLGDLWPTADGTPFNDETTSMVSAALAFARLGYERVALERRHPPYPDLFAFCAHIGTIAVEVTSNADPDEREFQVAMQKFIALLNDAVTHSGAAFPNDLRLGFIVLPRYRDYPALGQQLLAQIQPNLGKKGTFYFSGELAEMFAPYSLSDRGNANPVSGGAVVNFRGHADFVAATKKRILKKRDRTVYRTDGRPLWLIVSTAIPLMGPDVLGELFNTDFPLGKFDRIICSADVETLTFSRVHPAPAG